MSRPFQFKQFQINQAVNPQKVGTDSMLLGAWTSSGHQRILDIGTGTGILALMMAQRNPNAAITAIEPDADSLREATLNFQQSQFRTRIHPILTNLQSFGAMDKFDLIITNPPYFENAFLSENQNKNRARHTNDLPIHELYECAADLLNENGRLSIVCPTNIEETHFKRAVESDLFPARILRTLTHQGVFKRSFIEFSFSENLDPTEETLVVRNVDGSYTAEYITLTKDFYQKNLSK